MMVVSLASPRVFRVVEFSELPMIDALRSKFRKSAPPLNQAAHQNVIPADHSPPNQIGQIATSFALLKKLPADNPTRRQIETKIGQILSVTGSKMKEADAFAVLYRKMDRGQNGNLLLRHIENSAALSLSQPLPTPVYGREQRIQPSFVIAKTGGKTLIKTHNAATKNTHRGQQHRPDKYIRKNAKIENIRVGLETAKVSELADRHIKAEELYDRTSAINDPVLARNMAEMAKLAERDIAEETARRLRSNNIQPSKTGNIDRDLNLAKEQEEKQTANLNRTPFALTPIGLMAAAMRIGKSTRT